MGLSALAFLVSLILPLEGAQPLGFGLAAGLLATAGVFGAKRMVERLAAARARRAAESDIHGLDQPAFVTDLQGRLLARNGAASGFPGLAVGGPVSGLFARELAEPEAVVAQLLNLTAQAGGARRELASGRLLRVIGRQQGAVVWIVSEAEGTAEESPLPEVRLTADGALLSMNSAAQRFLGADDGLAPRRIGDLPLRNGHGLTLKTRDGECRVTLVVTGEAEGVQRVTLVPQGSTDVAPRSGAVLAQPGLLDALPVPMVKIAADGHLIEANSEARAIFGLKSGALPPLFDLVEGMGRPIADWLGDAAEGNGLLKPEIVRAVIPGQELFLQIALGRMLENNEVVLVGILNDATELKTLEAQFVQSQKMQAIGQLAGGVAHDFNNLLTAISGHCDLLLLRHDAGDPEYSDLIQISQNANRAASLVGQLLAFSRKQNLKPQSIDIRDTMSDLAHLLNRLIGEKITLDVRHAPGPQVIRADRRQLEQVIVNLVVNARDAMKKDGGTITVRSHPEYLDENAERDHARLAPGAYVVIEVEDTGVGIPADVLSKIFEPFYTTKKTGEGTGLGLSTAYGIVKQTGGYIFCDSEVGRGTKFTLYFRATQKVEAEAPVEAPKEERMAPGDGVVLLVEDEAPVRAFAARALRLRGYTVVEADCAEEALEILEDAEMEIDIFVSDVIMPGEDGPTWVRKAREARPDVPVIFMSGYAEESRAENQARIPNSSFLPKPFSLQQLTNIVQEKLQ
ncbi:MAG: ATP-binding protein [Silicimonas sp.]|nr:ATP-binding protein [Silicimonas sp.]